MPNFDEVETAGILWFGFARKNTARGALPAYVPYADKNGLWARAWPAPDRSLIEQDWKPHIHGAVSLGVAIEQLIEDSVRASSPH